MIPSLFAIFLCLLGFYLLWKIPSFTNKIILSLKEINLIPKISIIIPARNEENRLPILLESLSKQTLNIHEIIVVDDESEDNTYVIAKKFGAIVIKGKPLPEGWAGKSWACWQGAQKASGELLLFLDADTWLEKDGLAKLIEAHREKGGLISVQPYHVVHTWYEQLSAFFNIVVMASMNVFVPGGQNNKPKSAFGPCVMCSKKDYLAVGGHQGSKHTVLEGINLGRSFLDAGLPLNLFGGKGAVSFRMYSEGLKEVIHGWTKGFATGATSASPLIVLIVIGWISGLFSASFIPFRLAGDYTLTGFWMGIILYFVCVLQIRWILHRIGSFSIFTSLLYPLPLCFFAAITFFSFITIFLRRKVSWKGRVIETRKEAIK